MGFEPVTYGFQIWCSKHSAMLPPQLSHTCSLTEMHVSSFGSIENPKRVSMTLRLYSHTGQRPVANTSLTWSSFSAVFKDTLHAEVTHSVQDFSATVWHTGQTLVPALSLNSCHLESTSSLHQPFFCVLQHMGILSVCFYDVSVLTSDMFGLRFCVKNL